MGAPEGLWEHLRGCGSTCVVGAHMIFGLHVHQIGTFVYPYVYMYMHTCVNVICVDV